MKSIKNFINRLVQAVKKHTKQGFSLIELLVVIAIIGVIAAVAIPSYRNYQRNAGLEVVRTSLNQIARGAQACLTVQTNPTACTSLAAINITCGNMTDCDYDGPGTPNAANPLCFEVSRGTDFRGCVSVPTVAGAPTIAVARTGPGQDCDQRVTRDCQWGGTPAMANRTPATLPSNCQWGSGCTCQQDGSNPAIDTTAWNSCTLTGTFTLINTTDLPECNATNGTCE